MGRSRILKADYTLNFTINMQLLNLLVTLVAFNGAAAGDPPTAEKPAPPTEEQTVAGIKMAFGPNASAKQKEEAWKLAIAEHKNMKTPEEKTKAFKRCEYIPDENYKKKCLDLFGSASAVSSAMVLILLSFYTL